MIVFESSNNIRYDDYTKENIGWKEGQVVGPGYVSFMLGSSICNSGGDILTLSISAYSFEINLSGPIFNLSSIFRLA